MKKLGERKNVLPCKVRQVSVTMVFFSFDPFFTFARSLRVNLFYKKKSLNQQKKIVAKISPN